MSDFAILADEDVSVTVGSETYRAYSVDIASTGSQIEARAFEDSPEETAVVIANKATELTLSFRFSPGLTRGNVVTVNITIGADTYSYSATVTSARTVAAVGGVVDYQVTLRVNPSTGA